MSRSCRRPCTIGDWAQSLSLMSGLGMSGPVVFDRMLLRARQRRARALGPETFLIDRVAADLAERLGAVLRQFDVAVDLGTPTDAVREALAGNASIGTLIAAKRASAMRRPRSSPTRRRCRSATARSIWSCRRSRCNSSTTCPAR